MTADARDERHWCALLGIEPGADAETIRAAHRRKAREIHPDVNPSPDANHRMAEINRACDILLENARNATPKPSTAPPRPRSDGSASTNPRGRIHFSFDAEPPAPAAPSANEQKRQRGNDATTRWSRVSGARRAEDAARWRAKLGLDARKPAPGQPGASEDTQPAGEDTPWFDGMGGIHDYYGFLGLHPRATAEEIAEAVTQAHMNLGKQIRSHEARRLDQAIREAWWVLRDPQRRAAYDAARRQSG